MPSANLHTNIRRIWLGTESFLPGLMLVLFVLFLPAEAMSKAGYLYQLSSFTGPVSSLWSRLAVDEATGDLYSLNRQVSLLQIYNQHSMLIHAYGEDYQLASAADLVAGSNSEVYLLQRTTTGQKLLHLDYRGELLGTVDLQKIPDAFQPFRPTRLEFRDEKLYLLDVTALRLVILSADGEFLNGYLIRDLLMELMVDNEEEQEKLKEMDFNGFCVDARGAMYFTAPASFTVFKMEPGGELRAFGSSGSSPGKFGIVAGIAVDLKGNLYVADKLRSVVIIFDKDFKFIREFGYRGIKPENLVAPDDVVIDERNNKIYVAQAANRGVSVFQLSQK